MPDEKPSLLAMAGSVLAYPTHVVCRCDIACMQVPLQLSTDTVCVN